MDEKIELESLLNRMPVMRKRLEAAAQDYRRYVKIVDGGAFVERWSRVRMHSPQPFGIERESGKAPGRPMKTLPRTLARHVCSGTDAREAVAFVFEYVTNDGLRYAQFWDHDEGGVSTVRYDYFEPAENVINVERVEFENGRPARFLRYARLGVSAEVYRYVAGKLSFIHGASKEHGVKGEPTFTVDHIHYLPDGSPMLIVRHWEGVLRNGFIQHRGGSFEIPQRQPYDRRPRCRPTGKTLSETVTERVLGPLGMDKRGYTFSVSIF